MHVGSPLTRRLCRPKRIPLVDWDAVNPFGLIGAMNTIARGIGQGRLQVGAHALPSPDVGTMACSHPIENRVRVGRTKVAAIAIVMLSMPITMTFVSAAYAESNPGSVARLADPFAAFVVDASQRFGVPTSWIRAIMRAESHGDIRAISPKGAMGLMQIMPSTWMLLRARLDLGANPYDPRDNIFAGAAFLRELHDRYGSPGFLAAYNAGPGRYEDHLATGRPLPSETRAYVAALAPKIGGGWLEDAVPVVSTARSWTKAPLFIGQDDRASAVDQASPPVRPNHPSNSRRVVDVSGLAPRSDSLFVRISDREPAR